MRIYRFFLAFLLAGLVFEAGGAYGQPSWFTDPESAFPHSGYLIGVGVGTGDDYYDEEEIAISSQQSAVSSQQSEVRN